MEEQEAILEDARLQLSYTTITAPFDGQVTRKSAEVGDYVQPGFQILSLVALDDIWIEANLKETQLAKISPGLPVSIEVDAYPDLKLTGKVESIMAGTGSAFSLFPPENATGNYVKIVKIGCWYNNTIGNTRY